MNTPVITMKPLPLLIGIIVVLALLSSPVLAISTSDLISQLRPQGGGTGTLSVTSSPAGADVYLDGTYKGTTPVTITGVSTGLHLVRVTMPGYEDYSSRVITPNDRTVHASLKARSGSTTIPPTLPTRIPTTITTTIPTTVPTTVPTGQVPPNARTGTLSVTSSPAGADVYLDGVQKGTTPVSITGVPTGFHLIRVTMPGYEDYSSRVFTPIDKTVHASLKVRSGSTTIPPTLPTTITTTITTIPTTVPITVPTGQVPPNARTGSLSVTSSPAGAEVYLDGVQKGTTPVTITGVSTGLHMIRVTLPGYEDYSTRVITPNDRTVHANLKVVRTGTLSVTSNPVGADVYLDGVYKGTTSGEEYWIERDPPLIGRGPGEYPEYTGKPPEEATSCLDYFIRNMFFISKWDYHPVTITGIPFGQHNLRVNLSGCEDYSSWIMIPEDKEVHVSLKRKFSEVTSIYSKPNIYLYSDRDLTSRVRLFPETAITVSDPPYRPGIGWMAEIRNGSLNGQGDFLFYEGTGHFSGWQKEEGYVIRGAYREQDMASMLGEYGFNEKETDEFIGLLFIKPVLSEHGRHVLLTISSPDDVTLFLLPPGKMPGAFVEEEIALPVETAVSYLRHPPYPGPVWRVGDRDGSLREKAHTAGEVAVTVQVDVRF